MNLRIIWKSIQMKTANNWDIWKYCKFVSNQKYAKYVLKILFCKPQTVQGKFGTIQFGNRTIWYWTILHQVNLAPWQYSTRQFGTMTICQRNLTADKLAPRKCGPRQFGIRKVSPPGQTGTRTIWHQIIWC